MQNIVIGIEGEVASGKTSICKRLAKSINNCIFIDGGAIYRGIILALEKSNIDIKNVLNHENIDALEIMKKLNVQFLIENHETVILINGNKIDYDDIQNAKNAMGVSKMAKVADNSNLFMFARNIIDEYKKKYNIIVSARDLVEIYPDMTCHIYITAELNERIKRRYNQYNGKFSYEEIKNMIIQRDKLHDEAGFNLKCSKSIVIDVTECKNEQESTDKVINKLKELNIIE